MKTPPRINPIRLALLLVLALGLLGPGLAPAADPPQERLIRPLVFIAYSEGVRKDVAETHKFIADQVRKLGLTVEFKPMLYQGVLQNMWYTRNFDLGTLSLTGRPTRVDPHLIMANMYHSRTDVIGGYNYGSYHNPEFDRVMDASGQEMDREKRRALLWQAQEMVTRDVPLITVVHQMMVDLYNNQRWKGFVNMIGNGLKNVFTWTQVEPLTDKKVLVASYNVDAGVLNPMTAHEMNQIVCRGIYDTLTKVGPDGHPVPWLAESWKYLSDTEIEFKLRKNHKWHDGRPVTAKDVKFTVDFIRQRKIGFHLDSIAPIKEVKVIDDLTVRYVLNYPFAPLLAYTGEQLYIVPEHIWKDGPDKAKVQNPMMWAPAAEGKLIGSGFLKFGHWRKNNEIKLDANKDHFFAPKYESRILKVVPSAEAALGMLRNGEIDMIITYQGDPEAARRVCDADPKLTMNMEPSVGWFEIDLNARHAPLDDVVLRRAIAGVIPRDVIAKNIWKGYAIPAYSPIHPNLKPWHNPNVTKYDPMGLEWSRDLLKKAGYEWDSQGRLHYPPGRTDASPRMDLPKK